MSQRLLHCLFNAENFMCNIVSEEILILRLVGRTQPESRGLSTPLFSVPKYSAELGLDPQADFANQPESQQLLGSAVLCHPSGAYRVLDLYTP